MPDQSVTATMRYLLPGVERPVYIASTGGADAALDIGAEFEERAVTLHDARRLPEPAALDRHGFALHAHRSAMEDFYDIGANREDYEAELRHLVLAATGASAALVFDHTLRSDSRARERTGELQLALFNPDHRWYYYPAMNRDEVLLIKTFDAATDGVARRSIHSAFDNPLAPADAPPRESLESRLLVFF